jgi:hypothetical protein
VETVEQIEPTIRSPSRRYQIDEMRTKPLPSGHKARRRGIETEKADVSVILDIAPSER